MADGLKKLLYLEDDPFIAEVAVMALEEFSDIDVLHCDRGSKAIDAFPDFAPDLLLFDVMLPDMDGVQTLSEIRKLKGGEATPVIFMTAKAQIHEQQHYLDLGAVSVIVKPFDAFTLGDQLKSIWADRG